MSLSQKFLALRGRTFISEDGDEYTLTLLPPMSQTEIARLEQDLPCPLPSDVRELLGVTSGFANGPLDPFDLSGDPGGFGLEEIFPHALSIGHDGFGNYWVVDLLPTSTTWGPIYYACHDAPVIVYQAIDLGEFLDAQIEFMETHKGPLDFVHEDAMHNIWQNQPNTISVVEARRSSDPEIREFSNTLIDGWLVVDLRSPAIGDGFAWGRAKSTDHIKRWKTLPIFAYLPKKSMLARIFGR